MEVFTPRIGRHERARTAEGILQLGARIPEAAIALIVPGPYTREEARGAGAEMATTGDRGRREAA